jgi:ArsR family transcriptional regulator
MTVSVQARHRNSAKIVKALAHPTRLFMLEELGRGERTVRELTDMVGVEMPTVSRHLSLLKNAGILEDEKRGAQVFYRVRTRCVMKVFDCLRAIQTEISEN